MLVLVYSRVEEVMKYKICSSEDSTLRCGGYPIYLTGTELTRMACASLCIIVESLWKNHRMRISRQKIQCMMGPHQGIDKKHDKVSLLIHFIIQNLPAQARFAKYN